MGALSPRTRNAQVDLYQSGEVDYLVATDAIGMGLNLDIDHVAFSSLSKFDGRRMRPLQPNELAQIAGPGGAGHVQRHLRRDGRCRADPEDWAEAICNHSFTPLKKLQLAQRRSALRSIDALDRSLEASPDHEWLSKAREADDHCARCGHAGSRSGRGRARASAAASGSAFVGCLPHSRLPRHLGGGTCRAAGRYLSHICTSGTCIPDDFLARQLAGSTGRMATSTHCRNGWPISGHGHMSRSAAAGWLTKTIGAGAPRA